MTMDVWLAYVGTLLLFMSTPGPSHLLMISVSLGNGFRRSLATAVGDLSANTIQILLAGFGLAVLVTGSRYGFALVKWAGVAYLVWIGLRTLRASFGDRTESRSLPPASLKLLWLRGFITSAANPKAVVFFAALFPQFLDPATMLAPQITILGATYIVIDGLFLMAYGRGASWLAAAVADRHRAWLDRGAGVGLIAAAVLLGLRSAGR